MTMTTTTATTTTMNAALSANLAANGATPILWGRRVNGDANGVTIERNGERRYIVGPFTAVRGGDQIAIVRWG